MHFNKTRSGCECELDARAIPRKNKRKITSKGSAVGHQRACPGGPLIRSQNNLRQASIAATGLVPVGRRLSARPSVVAPRGQAPWRPSAQRILTGYESSVHRDKPGGASTAKSCTVILVS